jgi:hypothetical protein
VQKLSSLTYSLRTRTLTLKPWKPRLQKKPRQLWQWIMRVIQRT